MSLTSVQEGRKVRVVGRNEPLSSGIGNRRRSCRRVFLELQVKLSLCLIKGHAMKNCQVEEMHNMGTKSHVVSFKTCLFYPWGNSLSYQLVTRIGEP
jgi:hypothetical protein